MFCGCMTARDVDVYVLDMEWFLGQWNGNGDVDGDGQSLL